MMNVLPRLFAILVTNVAKILVHALNHTILCTTSDSIVNVTDT